MTETEKLLKELIALRSVNPAFLPEGHPDTGESRVAKFLGATAKKVGLDVKFQEVASGRSNVIARLSPKGKVQRRILFVPHMDTVPTASETQFVPRVSNGRIYGRGACDTKGSVAAMLAAVMALAKNGGALSNTEIIFTGVVDEENAQAGSRTLVADGLRGDFAIIGEPTRLRVVTAHKGSVWLRFKTHGKAAHGSCPDLGKNAVHEMARVVDFLETDYARLLRQRKHPLLGCATVSVGSIKGGAQPNIVPDSCLASVDRRTLPGETEKSVLSELRLLFKKRGLNPKIESEKSSFCLPMETDHRIPLAQTLLSIAGQSKPLGVNYFCDASVLAAAGTPSVVFGPGDIAQAHTSDEWISLDSLNRATQMLLKFIQSLP